MRCQWKRGCQLIVVTMFLTTTACTSQEGRWYTQAQVETGRQVFKLNCAVCHGEMAQGTAEWRSRDASGNLPPPPLNGTAHVWHHPMSVLLRTIERGGIPLGGTMPGFGNQLSDAEKRMAIAYFQSFWSEAIYRDWLGRGGLN